jgi:adenosine deaminase
MCKSPLHPFLAALPKCEHHIHLEGSLEPSLLFELAKTNGIALPADDPAYRSETDLQARYKQFTSLDDFLAFYYIGMSVLIHAADFEVLAWEYFIKARAHGVHHAEVFFDPQAHLSRGVEYRTIISGFEKARARARDELGLTSELICCFLRHLPVHESLAVFEHEDLQASFTNGTIKGIGLDSSELNFPPYLWAEIYQKAGTLGLKRTAHAGEEGPAAYIAGAIDSLGVERIDHGIQLYMDTELMRQVAEERILLTVCPLSNVLLRCVDHVGEVPIRKFLDAGVKFSINSDDPAYFGGYILNNYCAVHEAHDLTLEEWASISRAGIEGSWCSVDRKREMLAALDDLVKEWQGKV